MQIRTKTAPKSLSKLCKFIFSTQTLSHSFKAAENDECLVVYRRKGKRK